MSKSVLFVGAGNMGRAIVEGYLASGGEATNITVVDPFVSDETKKALEGVHFFPDFHSLNNDEGFGTVVLATKPQVFSDVSSKIADVLLEDGLVVSIMAGISCDKIQSAVGSEMAVVRCMPNMAAAVGHSANTAYATHHLSKPAFEELFQGSGPVRWIESEDHIHLTTAVSGSGPAYFFAFVEALATSGAKFGLSEDIAMDLAIDTLVGAGELLKANRDPSGLRLSVTSKGGTTAAALDAFAHCGNLQAVVDDATEAAISRSKELAKLG